MGGLIQNDLEVLFTLLRGGVRLPQELRKAFDSGDRGLEFVGEVVDEVGAQGLDALQLFGHLVEILIGRLEGAALLRLQILGKIPVATAFKPRVRPDTIRLNWRLNSVAVIPTTSPITARIPSTETVDARSQWNRSRMWSIAKGATVTSVTTTDSMDSQKASVRFRHGRRFFMVAPPL